MNFRVSSSEGTNNYDSCMWGIQGNHLKLGCLSYHFLRLVLFGLRWYCASYLISFVYYVTVFLNAILKLEENYKCRDGFAKMSSNYCDTFT